MTKLYCPNGHDLPYSCTLHAWCDAAGPEAEKAKHWHDEKVYTCFYCTPIRPYLEMDCLTAEQLNDPWRKYLLQIEESYKSLKDVPIDEELIKRLKQNPSSSLHSEQEESKAEEPWINFSDRKPEVGQEIMWRTVWMFPQYSGPAKFLGESSGGTLLEYRQKREVRLYQWRPAQPEIQGSSESNTKEVEKKDSAFETSSKMEAVECEICFKSPCICNLHPSEYKEMVKAECEHDTFTRLENIDGKILGKCSDCKQWATIGPTNLFDIDDLKPQSQIAIEKVIDAYAYGFENLFDNYKQEIDLVPALVTALAKMMDKLKELNNVG